MPPIFLFFPTVDIQFATRSIDLDGSTESLRNLTNNAIGIANTWSISIWGKNVSSLTGPDNLLVLDNSSNNNSRIVIELRGDISNDPIRVALHNTSGTLFKLYSFENLVVTDEWFNFTLTWDGTNLLGYFNGSSATAVMTIDNAGTMDDTTRRVFAGVTDGGANFWEGLFFSFAIWDVELSPDEVSAIYNEGNGAVVDLTEGRGDYVSSGDLQHYWVPGFDEDDIGGDRGNASTLIDIDTNAQNITAADDLVEDVPEG